MMLRTVLLLVAAISLSVLAGGAGSAGAASSHAVVVRFVQSGGIAGIDRRLIVRADRTAIVSGRGSASRRHTVTASTLRALRKILDAAHVERPLPRTPSGCADCFNYSIGYGGHRASFDEVSVPPRMAKAVRELQRIAGGGR